MAEHTFTVVGLFKDLVTGPATRAAAALNGVFAAANRSAVGRIPIVGAAHVAMVDRLRKSYTGLSGAMAAFWNSAPAYYARHPFRGMRDFREQYGDAFRTHTKRHWTPFQQSLAAAGGYGYALGRGGPVTAATVGTAILTYSGLREYRDFEASLVGLRKAANLTRPEMESMGDELQVLAHKYGQNQDVMGQIATEGALAGLRDKDVLLSFAEEVAKGLLTWEGATAEGLSQPLAKMMSVFHGDKSQAAQIEGLKRFIETVDYLEDNFPVKSEQLMSGFGRMMGVAKSHGFTPEESLGTILTMLMGGEGSGERAGGRSRITVTRMADLLRTGMPNKKLDWKGVDRKKLAALADVDEQLAENFLIAQLLAKYSKPTGKGKNKKPPTPAQAKAMVGQWFKRAFGAEASSYLEQRWANYEENLAALATINRDIAKMAVDDPKFIEWMKKRHKDAEQRINALRDFAAGGPTPYAGTIDKNVAIARDSMKMVWDQAAQNIDQFQSSLGNWIEQKTGFIKRVHDWTKGLGDWMKGKEKEAVEFNRLTEEEQLKKIESDFKSSEQATKDYLNKLIFQYQGKQIAKYHELADPGYIPEGHGGYGRPGETYGPPRPRHEPLAIKLHKWFMDMIGRDQPTAAGYRPPGFDISQGEQNVKIEIPPSEANITVPVQLQGQMVGPIRGTVTVNVDPGSLVIRNPGASGGTGVQGDIPTTGGVAPPPTP